MSIGFSGRTALVTGAGHGLGRGYALELARRGANVVVNDLDAAAANATVAAIEGAGGIAVVSFHSVSEPECAKENVELAIARFGRADIVIANAGFLCDRSFARMSLDELTRVIEVHLFGAIHVIRAAWPHMTAGNYGRIVLTTSTAALYGNFGQANYAAAKLGLVGLMNVLKIEGRKHNIAVNTVAPLAATRLGDGVFPVEAQQVMSIEFVVPLVAWLCSETCAINGEILQAGAGHYSRVRPLESLGVDLAAPPSAEDFNELYEAIADMKGAHAFDDAPQAVANMLAPAMARNGVVNAADLGSE